MFPIEPASRYFGGKGKQTASATAGDDGRLRLKDVEFAGPQIDAGCSYDPRPLPPLFGQQASHQRPIVDFYTQAFRFFVDARLDVEAPDTDNVTVFIIVTEHELGLVIPELRSFELIVYVPDLHPHRLALQQSVPSFLADDVTCDPIGVSVHGLQASLGIVQGRDFGAGIGTGAVPVIDASASGPAALGVSRFHKGNGSAVLCGADGGATAGYAAAYNQHINRYHALPLILNRVGPFRRRAVFFDVFIPCCHKCPLCLTPPHAGIIRVVGFIFLLQIAPVSERPFSCYGLIVVKLDCSELIPVRRVHYFWTAPYGCWLLKGAFSQPRVHHLSIFPSQLRADSQVPHESLNESHASSALDTAWTVGKDPQC